MAFFRDTTLTFTIGDKVFQVNDPWSRNTSEMDDIPVYQDCELWVDAAALLRIAWSIHLDAAIGDRDNVQKPEEGSFLLTL